MVAERREEKDKKKTVEHFKDVALKSLDCARAGTNFWINSIAFCRFTGNGANKIPIPETVRCSYTCYSRHTIFIDASSIKKTNKVK
jgi:hypothetical protein